MKPVNLLKYGDVIGIISPSWVANRNDYEKYAKGIESLGFRVKFGRNIYKDTYRYTASTEERADDLIISVNMIENNLFHIWSMEM